jgi:hypothetical protein
MEKLMHSQPLQISKSCFVRIAVIVLGAVLILTALPGQVIAQQNNAVASSPTASPASSTVPQIIQFSGHLNETSGGAASVPSGTVSITFTLYENEQGGTPLWSETQNVEVDAQGRYTALLGSASPEGLPLNLFTTVQAHWLAVQPAGLEYGEQPRVLLVSAPYALKAGDAETIGGLPPSAFVKALPTDASADSSAGGSGGMTVNRLSGALNGNGAAGKTNPPTCAGVNNYIPFWHPNPTLCRSVIWQTTATGPTKNYVGINNTNPGAQLDVTGYINTSMAYSIGDYIALAEPGGVTNIALGYQALYGNTTGINNTATGTFALTSNTTGSDNTANGYGTLDVNTTGADNTAIGLLALASNTTGGGNTASGLQALQYNTTGSSNTASGLSALQSNTTAGYNTATGFQALYNFNDTSGGSDFETANGAQALFSDTAGFENTASGGQALYSNTTGSENTANGYHALYSNTSGYSNTASGVSALYYNTTGISNTASGGAALYYNTTGSGNTAIGFGALVFNTVSNNSAFGYEALYSNSTGGFNTAEGYQALYSNSTGSSNTANGYKALYNNNANNNTAYGSGALANNIAGTGNIAIGRNAGLSVSSGNSNNIEIGNGGSSGDSGAIRIGTSGTQTSFFAAGVEGVNVSGATVIVSSSGQLGVASSSRRFKEDIHDMANASEGLMRLRPVTFRYKKPFEDGTKPIQYGLIAEEVAEVYPDLVARSADGQIETVKYQLLDPMLLNEVQRQHAVIRDLIKTQKAHDLEQQNQIKAQQALLKTQQALLKTQQAQIAELASNVETIQASLRTRRGSGHSRLASAKATPTSVATVASLPLALAMRGGN